MDDAVSAPVADRRVTVTSVQGLEGARLLLSALDHVQLGSTSVSTVGCSSPWSSRLLVGVDDAVAAIQAAVEDDLNVFFGVQPVAPGSSGRGTASDIAGVVSLYADLDCDPAKLGGWPQVKATIDGLAQALGMRPTAVVLTGHGFHPYWVLAEPLEFDTDQRRAEGQALLARWRGLVEDVARQHSGAVDNVFDLPRVLRAPGSRNLKDPQQPLGVVVSEWTDSRLDVAELIEALDSRGIPAVPPARAKAVVFDPAGWPWAEETCGYATAMIEGWADDRPKGGRHQWLLSQAVRLGCARRYGCLTEVDYHSVQRILHTRFLQLLQEPTVRQPTPVNEVEAALGDGLGIAAGKSLTDLAGELGGHGHDGVTAIIHATAETTPLQSLLTEEFWTADDRLDLIRQAAWARMLTPESLLVAVLALVNSRIDPKWTLPPIVGSRASLNLLTLTFGKSGTGKSSAQSAAVDLTGTTEENWDPERYLPDAWRAYSASASVYSTPLGSGEGLGQAFYEWVEVDVEGSGTRPKKRRLFKRVRSRVLVKDPEGIALHSQISRAGATLAEVLLKAFSGETLGHSYSKRNGDGAQAAVLVSGLTYRLAMVLGIQPDVTDTFFDLAGIGLPQRLLWGTAEGDIPLDGGAWPEPVPPWSGPAQPLSEGADPDFYDVQMPEAIRREVRSEVHRHRVDPDASNLDSHTMLVTLKVAATLAAWLRPGAVLEITAEDWRLAKVISAESTRVREQASAHLRGRQAHLAESRDAAAAKRAVRVDASITDNRVLRVARVIFRLASRHQEEKGDGHTCARSKCLRRAVSSADRESFDEALLLAVEREWLVTVQVGDEERFALGQSIPRRSR